MISVELANRWFVYVCPYLSVLLHQHFCLSFVVLGVILPHLLCLPFACLFSPIFVLFYVVVFFVHLSPADITSTVISLQTVQQLNWPVAIHAITNLGVTHVLDFGPTNGTAIRTAHDIAYASKQANKPNDVCVITVTSTEETDATFPSGALFSSSRVASPADKSTRLAVPRVNTSSRPTAPVIQLSSASGTAPLALAQEVARRNPGCRFVFEVLGAAGQRQELSVYHSTA